MSFSYAAIYTRTIDKIPAEPISLIYMGLGDFYKGDKKKKQKKGSSKPVYISPLFVPPQVAQKGKNKY